MQAHLLASARLMHIAGDLCCTGSTAAAPGCAVTSPLPEGDQGTTHTPPVPEQQEDALLPALCRQCTS